MPRITTGTAKNRNLKIPDIPDIRVVQDVAKLALFSILGGKVLESQCLDLYAGSGGLGIEALSRGAEFCEFVDESKKAELAIKENLKKCGFLEKAEVVRSDSLKFVANAYKSYDLIFADPFYNDIKHRYLLKNLAEITDTEGKITFFHGKVLDIEQQVENTQLKIDTQRRFGKSYLTIMSKT